MLHFFKLLPALLACFPTFLFCQSVSFPSGARAAAITASVSLKDGWAALNNVGALGFLKDTLASSTFETRYGIPSLNSGTFLFALPYKSFATAVSLSKLGDQLYSEECLRLAFAHKISNTSIGIGVNYFQMRADEGSSKHALIIEFGGVASILPDLSFAAHIFNLTQSSVHFTGQKYLLPVRMNSGLSYTPHKNLLLTAEAFKESVYHFAFHAGMEYSILRKIFLRTGIDTFPHTTSFGAGLKHRKIELDYAINFHQQLGAVQQFSMSFKFNREPHGH